MRTPLITWTSLALVTGCGAAGAPSMEATTAEAPSATPAEPTPEEKRVVAGYETEVAGLEADLRQAFELAGGPDCARAAELRDRICELSERVCTIADRHPGWPDVRDQCEDGRARCDAAADLVAQRCGE